MSEERVVEDDEAYAAEFTARLLSKTPQKGQKLVNYYGIYSNKVRCTPISKRLSVTR